MTINEKQELEKGFVIINIKGRYNNLMQACVLEAAFGIVSASIVFMTWLLPVAAPIQMVIAFVLVLTFVKYRPRLLLQQLIVMQDDKGVITLKGSVVRGAGMPDKVKFIAISRGVESLDLDVSHHSFAQQKTIYLSNVFFSESTLDEIYRQLSHLLSTGQTIDAIADEEHRKIKQSNHKNFSYIRYTELPSGGLVLLTNFIASFIAAALFGYLWFSTLI